jgi:hypothetical protein
MATMATDESQVEGCEHQDDANIFTISRSQNLSLKNATSKPMIRAAIATT